VWPGGDGFFRSLVFCDSRTLDQICRGITRTQWSMRTWMSVYVHLSADRGQGQPSSPAIDKPFVIELLQGALTSRAAQAFAMVHGPPFLGGLFLNYLWVLQNLGLHKQPCLKNFIIFSWGGRHTGGWSANSIQMAVGIVCQNKERKCLLGGDWFLAWDESKRANLGSIGIVLNTSTELGCIGFYFYWIYPKSRLEVSSMAWESSTLHY